MGEYVLETHNLSKSFGKTEILHDVGLSIEHGEVYGLVGQNGCYYFWYQHFDIFYICISDL